MRRKVFEVMHDRLVHRGARPVIKKLGAHFHWPHMSRDIRMWNRTCPDCQRRKNARPLHAGLTKSMLVSAPGQVFLMDFAGGLQGGTLPTSPEGFIYLLIVMDAFTRYPFGVPLKSKDPVEIADRLMSCVFAFTGFPKGLHSDNDTVLCGEAMDILFLRLGVRRSTITVRHPQGNSMVERFMRYLNAAFTIVLPQYTAWVQVLPTILLAYRTLPHATTGFSPHFLMTGREPLLPLELSVPSDEEFSLADGGAATTQEYASLVARQLVDTFRLVRDRQDRASRNNAARRDANRVEVTFQDNDPVLYYEPAAASGHLGSNRPLETKPSTVRAPSKWRFPWSGPHVIVGRKSDNVYNVYHTGRQVVLSINVDSLVLYHPFAPLDVNFEHFRNGRRPVKPAEVVNPPPSSFFGQAEIDRLSPGDLCVVRLEHDGWEPLIVMKFLRITEDGRAVLQWFSNDTLLWYIDVRLREQTWLPMWWQESTQQYYYSPRPLHPSHSEYSTLNTDHVLTTEAILFFGFKLRSKHRLPLEVAEAALGLWRSFEVPACVTNPRTYELESVKNNETLVPCNCTLNGCMCDARMPYGDHGLDICSACKAGECILPCSCPTPGETFELYQCTICSFTASRPFVECYQTGKRCSGRGHSVFYCVKCRHRIANREPPQASARPRKKPRLQ